MLNRLTLATTLAAASLAITSPLRGDEVIDWNRNFLVAAHNAAVSPLVFSRVAAMMHSAVFDAVNGIEGRYTPLHVAPDAPRGASERAAAIQAAYVILSRSFPPQAGALLTKRDQALNANWGNGAIENSQSIARGLEWGQTVADAIWAWRTTDGFSTVLPPYLGSTAVGQWRPTPPPNLPAAGVQFATMTPWAIEAPNQFRGDGPPALNSAQYTADFEEVRLMGSATSLLRTADETLAANYWQFTVAGYSWNSATEMIATEHNLTLSENARLFAMLNIGMADAVIACWDAKYTFNFWRPITAIQNADLDGNPDTTVDPSWTPLLVTPNHPDYPSGHSTVSGAASKILAAFFGDNTPLVFDSDVPAFAGVYRIFPSFSTSLDEIVNARVFGGIHFRTACREGNRIGFGVADYVLTNAMQPVHGNKNGH